MLRLHRFLLGLVAVVLALGGAALAGPKLVELTVVTDPPGGEIRVDGKSVGSSIAILQVRPGAHRVDASWPTGGKAEAVAQVTAARPASLKLTPGMTAVSAAAPAAPPAATAAPVAATGKSAAVAAAACPAGKRITEDTAGQCCWEGQAFAGGKCIGLPTSCPEGFAADAAKQSCEEKECEAGKVRAAGVHACCWPGQVFHKGRQACIGVPSSCPPDATPVGESCVDVPVGNDLAIVEVARDTAVASLQAICPSVAPKVLAEHAQYMFTLPEKQMTSLPCERDRRRLLSLHEPGATRKVVILRISAKGHPVVPRAHMRRLLSAKTDPPPGFDEWLDAMSAQIAQNGRARGAMVDGDQAWSVEVAQGNKAGTGAAFYLSARVGKIDRAAAGSEAILNWSNGALFSRHQLDYLEALPAPPPAPAAPAPPSPSAAPSYAPPPYGQPPAYPPSYAPSPYAPPPTYPPSYAPPPAPPPYPPQ